MPNAIKYTTGSETLALKKGNFYIGTGDVGKGPSNTTGYYNGVSPSSGGYVIYLNKSGAPGDLSYHNAVNDSELISFTNNLAGQSFTSATQCLVYYAGQTDKVCLNRDYEGIVTNGLVLNVDAGFTPSYPRSGTTWYDVLSSNNGTLINGPTFNSGNGGSIVFDGADDFVSCSNNESLSFTNKLTLQIWCSLNENRLSDYVSPLMKTTNSDWNDGYGFYKEDGKFWFFVNLWDGAHRVSVNKTFFSMTNFVGTYDGTNLKLYENGILIQTGSSFTSNVLNSSANLLIGTGGGNLGLYAWRGNISQVSIYNRALSASEVLQNYNAQKGRFGL